MFFPIRHHTDHKRKSRRIVAAAPGRAFRCTHAAVAGRRDKDSIFRSSKQGIIKSLAAAGHTDREIDDISSA